MSQRKISVRTKILQDARSLIQEEKNWTQFLERTVTKGEVQYCMMGALSRARDKHEDKSTPIVAFFMNQLYSYTRGNRSSITAYNDEYGRKHSEILKLFDHVITASITKDQKEKAHV